MCVCCATIVGALRWGVALIGDILYWAFLTPSWDPLSGTCSVQAFDPHMGPHDGLEANEALFCFVFVMYYICAERVYLFVV